MVFAGGGRLARRGLSWRIVAWGIDRAGEVRPRLHRVTTGQTYTVALKHERKGSRRVLSRRDY